MSINNQMYELFEKMNQGYKNGDNNTVEQCANCWIQLARDNPFPYDTPEHEEFFQMRRCYSIIERGSVDQKINRRRMLQHAKKLCSLNPEQPYTFDKKAEAEERKAKEEWIQKEQQRKQEELKLLDEQQKIKKQDINNQPETIKKIVNEEHQTMLGVLPNEKEDKKPLFSFFRLKKKEGGKNDSK